MSHATRDQNKRIFTVSLTGLSPSMASLSRLFSYGSRCVLDSVLRLVCHLSHVSSHNPVYTKLAGRVYIRFRLFPVRSPLLGESRLLSFPEGTEMFHFPSFTSSGYLLFRTMKGLILFGFPHSEIPGSMPVSGSPRLIAAIHVLRRLPTPRHPSHALLHLTITVFYLCCRTDWIYQSIPIWSDLKMRIIRLVSTLSEQLCFFTCSITVFLSYSIFKEHKKSGEP